MKFPLSINSVIFIFIFGLINLSSGQFASDSCRTANNTPGSCVLITECHHLQTHLRMVNRPAVITNYIRNSNCGAQGLIPKICCAAADTMVLTESTCVTPDNREGRCRNILNCDNAVKLLQNRSITNDTVDFLRQSRCDVGISGDEHRVCCPISEISGPESMRESQTPEPIEQPDLGSAADLVKLNDLLPKRCGFQPLTDKLIGGTATAIDEYPWMALIDYYKESTGTLQFSCGGSLISKRYVLTAAHCISGAIITIIGAPYQVRLGEYDLSKEKDCVKYSKDEVGEGDCALPVQDIKIESYVPHPMYNKTIARENDIGLIRLERDAVFTDFIKPVCIPRSDVTTRSGFTSNYTVAGWGKTENRFRSEIKLHLAVPHVNIDTCEILYESRKQQLSKSTQICAGGEANRDTCQGDSGGPLMMLQPDKRWSVVGIVSFGPAKCAQVGIPGVYTKVASFLPWIGRNLEP